MKILIRNSDRLVIYADNSMEFNTESVSGNGWVDNAFNSTNATIEDAELPNLWSGTVWSYVNGVWSIVNTVLHAQLVEEDRLSKIPQSITKVQAMRAMKQTDINAITGTSMWTNFQALLASNVDANDEWILALDLQRNHPLVIALTPSLGKTDTQIDELFILGATL